ncbi:MAG: hypothetical protein GY928_31965 [Colwellia sp.]|nr:hypothetical protein [Colwellia sp.]
MGEEMPIKIVAWQCGYCNRYRKTKGSITRHERICFNNPDRKILEGQMAIFATMPRQMIVENSYGVPIVVNWKPPENIKQALMCVSKFNYWNSKYLSGYGYEVTIQEYNKGGMLGEATAKTFEQAISLACAKATGWKE